MATEKDLINGSSSKKKYEFTDGLLQDAKRTKFKDSVSRQDALLPASFPLSEIQICKCSHQCHKLTIDDKRNLFDLFNEKTFEEQSQYIINCMDLIETKKKKEKIITQRQSVFHYKLQIGTKIVLVCQKTLCYVLGVTQRRIQIIQNKIRSDNKKMSLTIKNEMNDNLLYNFNQEISLELKENNLNTDNVVSSILNSDRQLMDTKICQLLLNEKYPKIQISGQNYDLLTQANSFDSNENEFEEDVDDPVNDQLVDGVNFPLIEIQSETVRDSLEADGQLGRIKAEMRTEVMKLLDGSSKSSRVKRPKSPHDVLFLNELIREYFDWIGYKYTTNVFVTECELGKQPLDRSFLAQDLGVKETEKSKSLPLLFCIIQAFKELKVSTMSSC
ncbi:uncharacterized protein LOC122509378 [Leptopilina heterotoma]|uniref:uncharacterized protein LOC122509378 n=1 Tax=Leptopilina heterotoma TaxID=63436 RepID=UPI001CA87748|nr:uncharacterized protein LOC122509378 [Leptopilina heterotoma]